jgi:DNA-binding transcriptional LysR family regulator
MELRQLKYFVAVAEELHFGRAAERVHISQPPLSMQIRNLEDELGLQLLQRNSRNVELTEAGAVFLEEAKSVLQKLDDAVSNAQRIARGDEGMLSIGFVGPAMDTSLPKALREFRTKQPGVVLDLLEMNTQEQFDALASGKIQLGLMRLYQQDFNGFTAELFVRESYVLAMPKGHQMTGSKRVKLSTLKNEPFIFYPRRLHPKLYDGMLACFRNAGFTPNIIQEVKTKKTTLSLVASGIGISIVPKSSVALRSEGIQYRPIIGHLPKVEIFAVWDENRTTPLMTKFLTIIRKHRRISP